LRIGTGVTVELSTAKLVRWRGSLGAFALDPNSGWAMGIVDAATPHGPYIIDEPTHRAAVKAYFINAGLPADQIGAVVADYAVRGGGSTSDSTTSTPTQLYGINSVLTRVVNGIRVVESYAWARMTTAGGVDIESVFWPPIDMSVLNAAAAMQTALSDSNAHAAFLSQLPGTVHRDAGVVIHHTSSAISSPPVAYVAYDVVLDASPSANVRHFDASGVEFRLPQETLSLPSTTRR
jgi:hypothetical protein